MSVEDRAKRAVLLMFVAFLLFGAAIIALDAATPAPCPCECDK